jgi:hypothetical protein
MDNDITFGARLGNYTILMSSTILWDTVRRGQEALVSQNATTGSVLQGLPS